MRQQDITKRMPALSRTTVGVAMLIAQLFIGTILTASTHAATPTTVSSLTNQGWSTADTRTNGHVTLITDATAPLGAGALSLKTDSSPEPSKDKAQFMLQAGVPLATVAEQPLYYSTKQNSASFVAGLPSYQVAVNLNGDSGFTTLVYEPYTNVGNDGVQNGIWQQWNVGEGKFWSTKAVGSLQPSQGTYMYTLDQILAEFPNAQVLAIGVNIGSNNPGYDTEVDALAFNGNVYDFEYTPTAPTGVGFAGNLACGSATNTGSVTFSWNGVADATGYTYSVTKPGGTTTETTTPNTTAAYAFSSEGAYTYKVRANGPADTQSAWSQLCTITYDKTAPTVSLNVFNPMSGRVGTQVTLNGTTARGATNVTVFIGSVNVGTATVNANGDWSLVTTVPNLPYGIVLLRAVANDAASNTATAQSIFFVQNPNSWF